MTNCELCSTCVEELELSHIVPKFVTRQINKHLLGNNKFVLSMSNEREQDGYKIPLLCNTCEQIFSNIGETPFANKVFIPYLQKQNLLISYDKWLNFFIASLTWRILYCDLQEKRKVKDDIRKENEVVSIMKILQGYLLKGGKANHPFFIKNHMFHLDVSIFKDIVDYYPASFIKGSSISFVAQSDEYFYIFSSLAGLCVLTIIRQYKEDVFENTLIHEGKGNLNLGMGQGVKSKLIYSRLQREILTAQTRMDYKAYNKKEEIARSLFRTNNEKKWKLMEHLDIDLAIKKGKF